MSPTSKVAATLNPAIFRAYDIRGTVGEDLNEPVAEAIGKAYGTYIQRISGNRIMVGRDNRPSSISYQAALIAGLRSTGCDVTDIGVSPTPMLYFATAHRQYDGGVNVTGSHNPPKYNGFKLTEKSAAALAEEQIQDVRRLIESGDFATGSGALNVWEPEDEYVEFIVRQTTLARPLKLVVDGGNGVAGPIAVRVLREIGAEVIELYIEPDGSFPHHLPDPEVEETLKDLRQLVLDEKAELGIAFDGDGDRIGVIDGDGTHYEADYMLILLARDFLTRHPGAPVIFDVKCSQNVERDIREHGGQPIMYRTGHSLIKKKMREDGILLGGEVSGHMFFGENYYGVDDGTLASARLLSVLSRGTETISQRLATLPKLHASPELRIPCPDDDKFRVVDEIKQTLGAQYPVLDIDGVRATLPEGWVLVRPSNTNPYLTVRMESDSEAGLERIRAMTFDLLGRYPSVDLKGVH
jgi:phosphomannomutase/phosphoglucomutase